MASRLYLTASVVAVMTASLSSQGAKPASPARPSTAAEASVKKGQALISGTAVDNNAVPLPNARVRLRNLAVNEVEQIVTANHLGEYTFLARPDVPYVVEIVDRTGRILAVGDIITVQTGEVAGAIVAIPARLPAVTGVFGSTAFSVVSAAAGAVISVIDPDPPLSPER